ncbi:hypothetical protein FVE85_3568 [Porphyridium purpureum]|uniref:Galactosyltransferase C-terminal domain-containing protein n=1 Tax=Porphyridium purpureum TaxID=35688 RepID=A0A5J4YMG3_PORPP|nr:hypothetical protein FVE85_3568 [Porphyridium purpureum]|eukprot:POR2438..scf249_10
MAGRHVPVLAGGAAGVSSGTGGAGGAGGAGDGSGGTGGDGMQDGRAMHDGALDIQGAREGQAHAAAYRAMYGVPPRSGSAGVGYRPANVRNHPYQQHVQLPLQVGAPQQDMRTYAQTHTPTHTQVQSPTQLVAHGYVAPAAMVVPPLVHAPQEMNATRDVNTLGLYPDIHIAAGPAQRRKADAPSEKTFAQSLRRISRLAAKQLQLWRKSRNARLLALYATLFVLFLMYWLLLEDRDAMRLEQNEDRIFSTHKGQQWSHADDSGPNMARAVPPEKEKDSSDLGDSPRRRESDAVESKASLDRTDKQETIQSDKGGAALLNTTPASTGLRDGAIISGVERFNAQRSSTLPAGVSLVAVCMNRHETFARVLPTWLLARGVHEVIVVDWSSEPPLDAEPIIEAEGLSPKHTAKLRIVRAENEERWILSRAFNLAMSLVNYEEVVRLDCDYEISRDFVSKHPLGNELDRRIFYAGNWRHAKNSNEVHLNGALVVKYHDFWKAGGYDERIQSYGWDDEDLFGRLEDRLKLKRVDILFSELSHIPHKDMLRSAAQRGVEFAQVEVDLNRLILAKLPPWKPTDIERTESQREDQKHSNYVVTKLNSNTRSPSAPFEKLTVQSQSQARNLQDLVDVQTKNELWQLALGRRLHDSYQLPWDIMLSMSAHNREKLIRKIRELTLDDGVNTKNQPPAMLFFHAVHGLGSRLLALGSAMAFSQKNAMQLVVIWEPDDHLAATLDQLFDDSDFVVSNGFKTVWSAVANSVNWDSAWKYVAQYVSYVSIEDWRAYFDRPPLEEGLGVSDQEKRHIYWKSGGLISPRNGVSRAEIAAALGKLKPSARVIEALHSRAQGLSALPLFGIHARSLTSEHEKLPIDYPKSFGKKILASIDAARERVTALGMTHAILPVLRGPSDIVYVTSDSPEVAAHICTQLGVQALCSPSKASSGNRSLPAIVDALADLYMLSSAQHVFGSPNSSFSLAPGYMNPNCRIDIVSGLDAASITSPSLKGNSAPGAPPSR